MKNKLLNFCVASCMAFMAIPVLAQSAPAPDALYQAFGEKSGIAALMDDFVNRVVVDPRIGKFFKDTNRATLKASLTDQICVVTGGPCKYEGSDMKSAHRDLDIRKGDFNALVELLQTAMEARGIPFTQQNRLLALLAPMNRDVITVR